ncbi:alpha/beta hydrolase [Mycoplasma iguanae]|uniref:Alpha/beta hydrolase n=1 Tax=Mycoplasma iguanae TaxID=292461 RepID=A0ABY5R7I3_9MOLU|nr:alpha/beta hydrolase [Mycoplasma iguanae]UVD81453.1 alpha/beta hydrolase [Mycoplasma iguanae]
MINQKIDILGEKINYIFEDNKRPKILFLHGFFSNYKFANEIYNNVNRNFDIVAFDFPGCGSSSYNNDLTIDFYQKIALAFVEHFQLKNFYIVAHSLGAASAVYVASKVSVKKIFLGAPINYNLINHSAEHAANIKKWLLPTNIEEAIESTKKLVKNKNNFFEQNIANTAKHFLKLVNLRRNIFQKMLDKEIISQEYLEKNLKPLYEKVIDKCIFANGLEDNFVQFDAVYSIAKEFNAPLYPIENCGHAIFYEQNEKIYNLIQKMVDEKI